MSTRHSMNILVVSGSSRTASLNTGLATLVARLRPADAVRVLAELTRLPFYDADREAAGLPHPVAELRAAVQTADLLVLVTPEYNGTVPGLLGNAIDWLSRPHGESVLRGKPVLVLSASPSPAGGARAAEHLRTVLARIGAAVMPTGLSVPTAHQRLHPDQPDPQLATDLTTLLNQTTHALTTAAAQTRVAGAA